MRIEQILKILRQLAPESLAESWDKVGLQIGDATRRVERALLCIDLTEPVLEEAIGKRVAMVVAYHPLIFDPLQNVTAAGHKQRVVLRAIEAGIAVYCPHTALDSAAEGINDWLSAAAGPGRARPIKLAPAGNRSRYTLVTFVPRDKADALRAALARVGAGKIGEYTECSFNVEGFGTFRGGDLSNPTIGKRGSFERAAELRLEMVCPADRIAEVVGELRRSHPYETPAFDLYRVEAEPSLAGLAGVGQGRVVTLDRPVTVTELVRRVKRHLRVIGLDVSPAGPMSRRLTRIGFCAGAGGSLIKDAGAIDAFVTGEMRYHDVLSAKASGIAILLPGHTQTERPYLPVYRRRIIAAGAGAVEWLISREDRPPSRWT